ncbi:MAG TPA: helix-turn-helix domain-containing protein [Thermoanaerobaculia bacterium]|nr:helix-turn-helix domain-containing protein [Thermoanaerobaculia bacterium]
MSFRAVLQSEFDRRIARNPRYSLRAFARTIAVDHATISRFLRGRRRLTARAIRRIGTLLRVHDVEAHCSAENDRALLALLARPNFHTNTRWIAMRLGITIDDVNLSLQRLLRERRLLMASRDRWQEVVHG